MRGKLALKGFATMFASLALFVANISAGAISIIYYQDEAPAKLRK